MIRTNFHITEEQSERLRTLSERTGLAVAEIVRRAIDAHLEREEKKAKREGER